MFCPNCGKTVEEGTVFCPYCGAKVSDTSEITAHTPNKNLERKRKIKEFLGFRKMVSTLIIKILYILGALALTLGGIITFFLGITGWNDEGLGLALIGVGALIIGNLLWRIICESWILLFSIHDILASIERKKV